MSAPYRLGYIDGVQAALDLFRKESLPKEFIRRVEELLTKSETGKACPHQNQIGVRDPCGFVERCLDCGRLLRSGKGAP